MKKTALSACIPACIAAVIALSACSDVQNNTSETTYDAATDSSAEATEISVSESEVISSETEDITENESETASDISENIVAVDLEKLCLNGDELAENDSFYVSNIYPINGSVIAAYTYKLDTETYERYTDSVYINFVDIEDPSLISQIPVPEEYNLVEDYSHDEGFPARFHLINNRYDDTEIKYAVLTVNEDYTYEITEGSELDYVYNYYGHSLFESDCDIQDADRDFTTIVKGIEPQSDSDKMAQRRVFGLAIDENRFIYRKIGYESIPGFGIYNFETDKAEDVPETNDLVAIGIHNGKIYSDHTAWDGLSDSLYVTDIDTLETSLFLDNYGENTEDMYPIFAMSDDGEDLAVISTPMYYSSDSDCTKIYSIDSDTAECTLKYTLSADEYEYFIRWYFIGSRLAGEADNKLFIFDV
jgi:hypothetical protein